MSELPPTTPPAAASPLTPPPKRKKRRWWLRILIALPILLLILLALAPTIAGSGPVRGMVLSSINSNLNGSVSIDNTRFGWLTGQTIEGIHVKDRAGNEIASIKKLYTQLPLRSAISGYFANKYDLGKTTAEGVVFNVTPTTFDDLVKKSPTPPSAPGSPGRPSDPSAASPLPEVSIDLTADAKGDLTVEGQPPVHVDSAKLAVVVTSLDAPIKHNLDASIRVGDKAPGTVKLDGETTAFKNRQFDLNALRSNAAVALAGIDASTVNAVFAKAGLALTVSGTVDGGLNVDATGASSQAVKGSLHIKSFVAEGALIKGDRFETTLITVPIDLSRTTDTAGSGLLKIAPLSVDLKDQVALVINGQLREQALLNLADKKPPGAGNEGTLSVSVNAPDIGQITNRLRNTLALLPGTQITAGKYVSTINLAAAADQWTSNADIHLTGVTGTNNGRPVTLSPIDIKLAGNYSPSSTDPFEALRKVDIDFTSDFATAKGGGESIGKLGLAVDFNLDKLRAQAAQLVDLKDYQLTGTGKINLATRDDAKAKTGKGVAITTDGTIDNVAVTLPKLPAINAQQVTFSVAALAGVDLATFAVAIDSGTISFATKQDNAPVIELAATMADVDLKTSSVGQLAVQKFNVPSLAAAQKQAEPFVPALKTSGLRLTAGALYSNVAFSYDGVKKVLTFTQPLGVTTPGLTVVAKDAAGVERPLLTNEKLSIGLDGKIDASNGISANLTKLFIDSSSKLLKLDTPEGKGVAFTIDPAGNPGGNASLHLTADAKRLADLANAFGGKAVDPKAPGQPTSGFFDGTITLASSTGKDTLTLAGVLDKIGVTTAAAPIQNERVELAFNATTSDNRAGLDATGTIKSAFANVALDKTRIKLPTLSTTVWDIVQSANVDIAVPDLAKLYAIANAFLPATPPAAVKLSANGETPLQPIEPMVVRSGSASLKIAITRDSAANLTRVALTDVSIPNLAVARGKQSYAFAKPITFKLAAEVSASSTSSNTAEPVSIKSVKVTQLDGDLGVATLSMPTPISLSDLSAATPKADGAIAVDGKLDDVTPLLAVLQGGEALPYRGVFALKQKVATQGEQIALAGSVDVDNFVVSGVGPDGKRGDVFAEKKIAVRNDLLVTPATETAKINILTVDMPASKALGLKMTGDVIGWNTTRKLNGVQADLTYDLAKVWLIAYPMLAPESQKSMKDYKLAGAFTRTIKLSGAFPAVDAGGKALAFNDSIKSLSGDGILNVGLFDGSGLTVKDWEIPFVLDHGKAALVYAGKSKKERLPKPASANEGSLDVGGIVLDLTAPDPLLSVGKNQMLMKDVHLNPVLADAIGNANILFKNASSATGLVDVKVVEASNVPLGELTKRGPKAKAQVQVDMRDLVLDGPAISFITKALDLGNGGLRGQIRNGGISLVDGVLHSDIAFEIAKDERVRDEKTQKKVDRTSQLPLHVSGGIDWNSLKLENYNLNIPIELIPDKILGEKIRERLVNGIDVPVKGLANNPQFDFAGAFLKAGASGLLGGGGKDGGKDIGDAIGDLLGGKKKDKDDKKKDK